jgi:hypothetical protein
MSETKIYEKIQAMIYFYMQFIGYFGFFIGEAQFLHGSCCYDLFLYAIYWLLCLVLFIGEAQFLHGSCFYVSKARISFLS